MYDLAIFGNSNVAYILTRQALDKGLKVLLIGKFNFHSAVFGVVKDFLLDTALKINSVKNLENAGILVSLEGLSFSKIIKKRDEIAEKEFVKIRNTFRDSNLTLLEDGEFLNNYTFKNGKNHYLFKNLVIAKEPEYSPKAGFCVMDDVPFMEDYPRQIVIDGADNNAIEIAFILAQFYAKVHIIDKKSLILPSVSSEFNDCILKNLKKEKIKFYPNTQINEIDNNIYLDSGIKLQNGLLINNVRKNDDFEPLKKLNLEMIDGKIKTDKYLKTNYENIFFIAKDFSSKEQASCIISNLLQKNSQEFLKIDYKSLIINKRMAQIGSFDPMNYLTLKIKNTYTKLSLKDNKIQGVQVLDDKNEVLPFLYFAIKKGLSFQELENILVG